MFFKNSKSTISPALTRRLAYFLALYFFPCEFALVAGSEYSFVGSLFSNKSNSTVGTLFSSNSECVEHLPLNKITALLQNVLQLCDLSYTNITGSSYSKNTVFCSETPKQDSFVCNPMGGTYYEFSLKYDNLIPQLSCMMENLSKKMDCPLQREVNTTVLIVLGAVCISLCLIACCAKILPNPCKDRSIRHAAELQNDESYIPLTEVKNSTPENIASRNCLAKPGTP